MAEFFAYNATVLLNNSHGTVGILDLLTLLATWGRVDKHAAHEPPTRRARIRF